jgi:hypothetical protein
LDEDVHCLPAATKLIEEDRAPHDGVQSCAKWAIKPPIVSPVL